VGGGGWGGGGGVKFRVKSGNWPNRNSFSRPAPPNPDSEPFFPPSLQDRKGYQNQI